MMIALRSIDSKKSPYLHSRGVTGYVTVRIKVEEFAALANLEHRGDRAASAAYSGMQKACNGLQSKQVHYWNGRETQNVSWAWKSTYHPGEGWAEIAFASDLTPHIFLIKEKFTRYKLELARGHRSNYSWRLLELLMREQERKCLLFITVEDFRRVLEIPETYLFADIKRRVIEPAVKELNAKSEIILQWEPVKKGKAVGSLKFTYIKAQKEEDASKTLRQ